jgi:carboxymethylenebutenolidase
MFFYRHPVQVQVVRAMNRSFLSLLCLCPLFAAAVISGCTGGQTSVQSTRTTPVPGTMTSIVADGRTYPAYIAVPTTPGTHPGLVLIHSFNGLEPGYKEMCDRIASDGFVVIAPAWQTFNQQAGDPEVEAVVRSSIATLRARPDIDPARLGLTGFCAGGRFTMLFLPQMKDFKAGVA